MKLDELLAQKVEIDREITRLRQAQRAEALVAIRKLMQENGLTLDELRDPKPKGSVSPNRAGKVVAAKYRHPSTGQTWTGRGLKPKWLSAEMANGKALAEFLI